MFLCCNLTEYKSILGSNQCLLPIMYYFLNINTYIGIELRIWNAYSIHKFLFCKLQLNVVVQQNRNQSCIIFKTSWMLLWLVLKSLKLID